MTEGTFNIRQLRRLLDAAVIPGTLGGVFGRRKWAGWGGGRFSSVVSRHYRLCVRCAAIGDSTVILRMGLTTMRSGRVKYFTGGCRTRAAVEGLECSTCVCVCVRTAYGFTNGLKIHIRF